MEKTNKLDTIIFKFIKKYCFEILFFIVTVISLKMRADFFKIVSLDFTDYLGNWMDKIKEFGGFYALKQDIGNYNIPYLVIMAIVSYIPINPLITLKMVSVIFDYTLAISAMLLIYEMFKTNKNKHIYALLTYSIVIILPTVVLNSSAWCQCDSIYATFVLLALLFMIKEKYLFSFIFYGIAIAFKLQAIFVLPVFILLYVCNKKFSILYFLIIPVVNFVMCLPAIIMGRPIQDCMLIYLNQAKEYSNYIAMNIPNIYAIFMNTLNGSNLIESADNALKTFGLLFTFGAFAITGILAIHKDIKIDKKMIINLSLWSVMICTFLLPNMHDRYIYLADVISIIYYIVNRKNIYIPIIINSISLYTYIEYLYATRNMDIQYVALIYFVILVLFTKEIYKDLKSSQVEEIGENNG